MQDRVCLRRCRTINPAGRALFDYFVDGPLPAAKILFSWDRAIHSSTHLLIDPCTHQHIDTFTPLTHRGSPSYVSIIIIASSYHYFVTIDFPPMRRYFEHNPDLVARLAQ